ncbi:oxygen-independent coproporphyrinogen III oxidase [Dyella sp. A6]|uniref:oxygen-independent coproporphyrinogen III oxidase n=1 Tax=Dyella aluminiiresistens TaxID=3069105 RepID=UPI002E7774B7|nr:oxygen-independent coproporphyrinogen III oxidase [Dyella sp. A6]
MATSLIAPEFDPALVARYDVAGPRYTSYPTSPHFRADFDVMALRRVIRTSNEEPIPRPLSLYVHVPFCMSPCFYCGCNRVITRDVAQASRYLERLYREIELMASLFDRDRTVEQMHFGGGTPNFLDAAQMSELLESLSRHFSFSREPEREYGIEIDPRFADGDYVANLGRLGFNRISVGIQDFDPVVQKAVNRIQSMEQTREILDAARDASFRSASVDLIYGLPFQSVAGFGRTLEQIVALNPDRVAVYGYAHLPETFKAQRQIDENTLPDAATRLALFGCALEKLSEAGYVYVGMDHFAKADDELVQAQRAGTLQRNFQGYSTHGDCDIVGLGVSAIGRIGNTYSQNARDLIGYYAALDAGRMPVMRGLELDEDDVIRRELIGELMCHGMISKPGFGMRHRLLFDEYFANERQRLRVLIDDGLVSESEQEIRVTSRGRLLLRIIAMCFDAYLGDTAQSARYSRVI